MRHRTTLDTQRGLAHNSSQAVRVGAGTARQGEDGMRLAGKVAIITGAAHGMGAEEATLFAREGAKVMIADILENEGKHLEVEINQAGGEAMFVRVDVTSEADWKRVVEAT